METAYVLVQCKIAHEMEVLKALLEINLVKEAKIQKLCTYIQILKLY